MVSGPAERQARVERIIALGVLSALALLAYGTWLWQLGFYRDDWYVLWVGRVLGPEGIPAIFIGERPFMGQWYQYTYAAFGESALAWNVYALLLRIFISAMSLLLLRSIWPRQRILSVAVAVLVLLYPGFLQQTNAMTKSNQLATYLLALVSITMTAHAILAKRDWQRYVATILALATALGYQMLYEYMIGLEAGRLVIIWIITGRGTIQRRRQAWLTLLRWLPYGLVILATVSWRLIAFESARAATDITGVLSTYLSRPASTGVRLILEFAKDLVEATLIGWAHPYYQLTHDAVSSALLPAAVLAGLAVALCSAYYVWCRRHIVDSSTAHSNAADNHRDLREMALTGAAFLVFALLPVVMTLRDIRWSVGFDRYTLHATLGVALVLCSALWLGAEHRLRNLVMLGLVGSAVIVQNLNGLHWVKFWEAQRQLWWQLSWRAPQLEPETMLLVDIPVDGFYDEIDVWAPASMIYDPQPNLSRVGADLIREDTVRRLQTGGRDIRSKRMFRFPKDFTKPLVMSLPGERTCLHIFDGARPELPVDMAARTRILVPYSRIDLIDTAPASSPTMPGLFGEEPAHGWCYYYQTASLARQRQDWAEVARLADSALEQGLEPAERSEWLPFLEGYVFTGQAEQAARVAKEIRAEEGVRHQLCDALGGAPAPGFDDALHQVFMETLCEF